MPEAPEVYGYYNYIYKKLINKSLQALNILSGKYLKSAPENFKEVTDTLPAKIKDVVLHGKLIFIELDNGFTLEFSHGMTGYWTTEQEKHGRICLELSGKNLYFTDPRNFGRLVVYRNSTEYNAKLDSLGPKVLDTTADLDDFLNRIEKRKNSKIGLLLLDQSILSGVGNYLRCDILWYTDIHYETKVKDLSTEKLCELFVNSINITRFFAGLSCDLKVFPERNQNFVYMQHTDIYGNKVEKVAFGGRTIHFIKKTEKT